MEYTFLQLLTKIKKKRLINKSLKSNIKKINKYSRALGSLHVIYRISDAGYPKNKPSYITNENCLKNALREFPVNKCDWVIIADNCSQGTIDMIYKNLIENGFSKSIVKEVSIGSGAGTFRMAVDIALSFPENDIIYFLENDYVHRENSCDALMSAFSIKDKIDYVTLYDHPYHYDENFILSSFNMKSKIYMNKFGYWKVSPSTTMTFASQVKTIKKDKKTFFKWTRKKHAYDIEIFIELKRKKRVLLSPIPAYSTHGEVEYLSKFIEWNEYIK